MPIDPNAGRRAFVTLFCLLMLLIIVYGIMRSQGLIAPTPGAMP